MLSNPVSTKAIQWELHQANIHGKAAIAKPFITEPNAKLLNKWFRDPVPTHITWTFDDRRNVTQVDESSFASIYRLIFLAWQL